MARGGDCTEKKRRNCCKPSAREGSGEAGDAAGGDIGVGWRVAGWVSAQHHRRAHPARCAAASPPHLRGRSVLCLAYRDVTMPAGALQPASSLRTTAGSDSEGSTTNGGSPAVPAAGRPGSSGRAVGNSGSAVDSGSAGTSRLSATPASTPVGGGGDWVWDAGSLNTAAADR